LTASGWQNFGSLTQKRTKHSGHTLANTILLVGGHYHPETSEYIDISGKSSPGPRIQPGRKSHCGVTLDESRIVLIGGGRIAPPYKESFSVTLMEGLGSVETTTSKNLPSLNIGRLDHACGAYLKDDGNMELIVVGKYGDNADSTETFSYPDGKRWKLSSGRLPYIPVPPLRGATINGEFIITGFVSKNDHDLNTDYDYVDYYSPVKYIVENDVPWSVEILLWSKDSESWKKNGTLQKVRTQPGIVAVDAKTIPC